MTDFVRLAVVRLHLYGVVLVNARRCVRVQLRKQRAVVLEGEATWRAHFRGEVKTGNVLTRAGQTFKLLREVQPQRSNGSTTQPRLRVQAFNRDGQTIEASNAKCAPSAY